MAPSGARKQPNITHRKALYCFRKRPANTCGAQVWEVEDSSTADHGSSEAALRLPFLIAFTFWAHVLCMCLHSCTFTHATLLQSRGSITTQSYPCRYYSSESAFYVGSPPLGALNVRHTHISDVAQGRGAGGYEFTLVESFQASRDGDLNSKSPGQAMQSKPAHAPNTRKLHLACDEAEHMHSWVVSRWVTSVCGVGGRVEA
jgi:hypothetical protein